MYSGGLSIFWWAIFILMTCLYSAELSIEIVDYVCHLLQIVCPHFAQHTSKRLFYGVTMSTLDNITCHMSVIAYCN